MGTPGTRNAAIIWRIIDTSEAPPSEAEIKHATGLGIGTVNRLCRTMQSAGLLVRIEPKAQGEAVRYQSAGTIEQVRTKFCPPEPEPKANKSRPYAYFGNNIPRVNSVFQLGSL